ncbi:response regulator, partial [Sphingomonas sanguinis]
MTPPTILIVEDDPALRTLTARALQENGFAVKLANAAPEMWQALEVGQIDLILLDIMLPGTSGIDLCRQVRQKSAVPIIFISAKGSEVDRVVGLELGADDY